MFQVHMQRVTTWLSYLIGNAVVFISLPPRKGTHYPHFQKNPDIIPLLYLFVMSTFICTFYLDLNIIAETINIFLPLLYVFTSHKTDTQAQAMMKL